MQVVQAAKTRMSVKPLGLRLLALVGLLVLELPANSGTGHEAPQASSRDLVNMLYSRALTGRQAEVRQVSTQQIPYSRKRWCGEEQVSRRQRLRGGEGYLGTDEEGIEAQAFEDLLQLCRQDDASTTPPLSSSDVGIPWTAEATAQAYIRLKQLLATSCPSLSSLSSTEDSRPASARDDDMYSSSVDMYRSQAQDVFAALSRHAMDSLHQMQPHHIAAVLDAHTSLKQPPDDSLFERFLGQCALTLPLFEPVHLADALRACAEFSRQPGQELFTAMCNHAQVKSSDFDPRAVSKFLWSCAKLEKHPGTPLFAALCGRACARIGQFKQDELKELLWACAKLGEHPGGEILGVLRRKAKAAPMEDYSAMGIANLLWASSHKEMHEPCVHYLA